MYRECFIFRFTSIVCLSISIELKFGETKWAFLNPKDIKTFYTCYANIVALSQYMTPVAVWKTEGCVIVVAAAAIVVVVGTKRNHIFRFSSASLFIVQCYLISIWQLNYVGFLHSFYGHRSTQNRKHIAWLAKYNEVKTNKQRQK